MHKKQLFGVIFQTKYFAFIIAAFVCILLLLLQLTPVISILETTVLDSHFRWRERFTIGGTLQEGVTIRTRNPFVHPDILIVGVDANALNRFGRWPFPRRIHGNFINNLSRIQDQTRRERAVFLDFFFTEPAQNPTDDAMLVDSIEHNGQVFLETILSIDPPRSQDYQNTFARQDALDSTVHSISNVSGNWQDLISYQGMEPPLIPYGKAVRGYGHANFIADFDEVFRRQPMIAKSSELLDTYYFHELRNGNHIPVGKYERLVWFDRTGEQHTIELPMSESEFSALQDQLEREAAPYNMSDDTTTYLIRHFQDRFIPSITLALALEYFNVSWNEIEVEIGSHIRIPNPQMYSSETESWESYTVLNQHGEYQEIPSIRIPIDDQASMLINFSGSRSSSSAQDRQTFPVRSYAGYASQVTSPDPYTWPPTMALENKIVMVGAFATGMADDEKATPYGLMYGVEMHANALNTILMDRFIHYAPMWQNALLLILIVALTAIIASRLSTIWSLLFVILGTGGLFAGITTVFDQYNYILDFSSPAIGIFLTFISVVVYRVMTEERDKRRIRDMFGRYVSPQVVSQILENPPELGGIDKELTVLFSDIRGFTTLSESMTPQELVNHLNQYLTAMTDIILEFKGTLDKYVGDEIMCFWGAPLPQQNHALLACKCALKQIQALRDLNASWPPEKRINIGIGINSGIMTVGNMGSLGRMNYTLMGDNVNLGARLEGTNKEYKTQIIISEYTYGLIQDKAVARELDNIRVKGKNKPVVIYELLDVQE